MTVTSRRPGPVHPERDAEILRRWEEKESSVTIARALGVTRNTVLGVVCRAGKQRREGTRPQSVGGRKGAVRARVKRVIKIRPPLPVPVVALPPAPAPIAISQDLTPDLEAPPIRERRTIVTIAAGECRWPIGEPASAEFFFCGDPAQPGLSYCGFHCQRAFRPKDAPRDVRPHPRQRTGAFR